MQFELGLNGVRIPRLDKIGCQLGQAENGFQPFAHQTVIVNDKNLQDGYSVLRRFQFITITSAGIWLSVTQKLQQGTHQHGGLDWLENDTG